MSSTGIIARLKGFGARQAFGDGWRELVTPEGVDLRLRVGTYADRFVALLLDFLILGGGMVALTIVAAIVGAVTRLPWMNMALGVVWLLGVFLLRNFYFMAFEIGPRAATPGKRAMGLRVIAADGGRLTADAVFARNAMREVEVFLPLTFFAARGQGVDAALITLGAIWSGVFVIFPLFNRDRRRLGDLAAGTMVVKAPKRVLQPDLADTEVKIARIQIDSSTFEVTSVYARRGAAPGTIDYRIVDEYEGDTLNGPCTMTSAQPLSLLELVMFFLGGWNLLAVLDMNFEGDVSGMLGFFRGSSDFYPEFDQCLRDFVIVGFDPDRLRDEHGDDEEHR